MQHYGICQAQSVGDGFWLVLLIPPIFGADPDPDPRIRTSASAHHPQSKKLKN
jgi:hypothetical protein